MIDTNKIQEAYANKKRKTADKIASFENKNSHNEKLIGSDRVQRAIVETTRLNIEHRDGHEPRVTVKNFPKKISTPDFKKIVAELKNLEKSLAPKNIDFSLLIEAVNSLKEQVAKIPTEHPEQPEPIEKVTVKNLETLKPSINKLEDAIKKLKLDPKINVESPTIPELDLTPVANIMSQIKESVLSIKIPDNSKSLNEVVKAQKAVKSAIDNLTFPVPNYVLPYKNTAGAATQVQLDSNGNVPIAGSITVDTTGLATSANQTTEQALVGSLTETAPGTDTASSGLNGRLQRIAQRLTSLIALLPGSLGQKARTASLAVTLSTEDITALTPPAAITGFATSANQLPDGHNVTVDNGAGASAVNIQDGGNSITVDGTVTASNISGDVASGSADSGNPVKVGAKYNATQPTFTDGQRADMQVDSRGNLRMGLYANNTQTTASFKADNADTDATSATANKLGVMSRGTVFNGTTWDRARGDATNGTLVNLGSNNDVTVTSGAITETNSAAIKTAVETIDNAISGNEMQVDVVGALPAGTNAIGKLAANSGVDIGDVDVTSAVSSTLDHGSNLDIDTFAEQITSTSFACKFGVTLKADITNTGIIYIGNSDVTAGTTAATDGFPLSAGETLTLEVTNANIPYAIASANNQKIYWVGV